MRRFEKPGTRKTDETRLESEALLHIWWHTFDSVSLGSKGICRGTNQISSSRYTAHLAQAGNHSSRSTRIVKSPIGPQLGRCGWSRRARKKPQTGDENVQTEYSSAGAAAERSPRFDLTRLRLPAAHPRQDTTQPRCDLAQSQWGIRLGRGNARSRR